MTTDYAITITQKDIDTGIQGDIYNCPAAKAMRRFAHKHGYKTSHTSGTYSALVLSEPYDVGQKVMHSERLIQFITSFDKGETVKPGRYAFTATREMPR